MLRSRVQMSALHPTMTMEGWPKRPLVSGIVALTALAFFQWLLIAQATVGAFSLWFLALPLLLLAAASAIVTVRAISIADRGAIGFLIVMAAVLYLPPAEELALTGDAAIYVNEGIFVARSGRLHALHEPLAALPAETRTLFYVTSEEQFPVRPMQSYDGILYRSYYMADSATATIETSRMPLSTVWFAFAYVVAGVRGALYSTPLFALLSLLLLYAVARRLFRWPMALVVTMLLAVSYPQIYFGRISYAEIFGQFWTMAGLFAALHWIERRSPLMLVLAFFFWATTWAGRIDALLLLPAAYLLLIYAANERDSRSLIAVGLSLPLLSALVYLGTNGAYAGATFEIQQWRWPWFGKALVGLLLLAPVSTLIAWVWGRTLQAMLLRARPILHLLAFGGLAFVILWATIPNPLREAGVTRSYQEIIWFSSAYLTPLFYWLLLIGIGRLFITGYDAKTFWLLMLFYSLAIVFFYTYTSARVYPVSLRRLTSDLLPLMTLLIGVALSPLPADTRGERPPSPLLPAIGRGTTQLWQWGRWVVAIAVLLWMAWLSRPLLPIHEGANTVSFLEELHDSVPANAVLIFEDQDSDSWVGWLAAPLYSIYGDWALQLDGDTPDPALWREAINRLSETGRTIYVATQQPDFPPALLPDGYSATLEHELPWQSTLIGQTNAPYPPPVWNFVHPLRLYRLERANTTPLEPTPVATMLETTPISLSAPAVSLRAPSGKLQVELFVNDETTRPGGGVSAEEPPAQLYYRVSYGGQPIIEPSAIALMLSPQLEALQPLTITAQSVRSVDEQYPMALGQFSSIHDQYNEAEIKLHEMTPPHRELQLVVRLYDQAMALRQRIVAQGTSAKESHEEADSVQHGHTQTGILFDRVDFTLHETVLAYYQAGTEGEYIPMPVAQLPTLATGVPSENPLTIMLQNDLFVSITEAEVVDYPRTLLARRDGHSATLTTVPADTTAIEETAATETPWRVLLVAESAAALAMSGEVLHSLNPPSVLPDERWIRPGSAMRIMKLTTAAALEVIDFAATHGIDYVEFDAGWYGLGYREEANPASDATAVVEAIDMPQVLAHAHEQGVGVWLYVNHVALQQQLDALLPLYASWGVTGIKLGFVDGRSRAGINFVHQVVQKAAAHQLMVDVHDNYRPSGVNRTYPNLLTQEGVRGNEHYPGAEQQTILPFTRLLAGAADTTFLYYTGDLNVTRAHQLAAQIVFFSPLRFVLWYDSPVHYKGEPEIDFMGALPTVWDETLVLDGAIGDFITIARRKGEEWFVGAMTDGSARTQTISLAFLDPEQPYLARIYRDDTPRAVAIEERTVTATTTIEARLLPSGGQVLWLAPLDSTP